MPKTWGNWLWFGIPLLGLPTLVIAILAGTESLRTSSPHVDTSEPPPFSTLVIGWDGSYRPRVEKLLAENQLPKLKSLVEQGTYIKVRVENARTDTKAGWAQIWTGYSASITGVHSNRDYAPIPAGLTIFERLKNRYGSRIQTLFLSGKVNNIGARGPHKICINCRSRFPDSRQKTRYWEDDSEAPTKKGQPKEYAERAGEPYANALGALDVYQNGLGSGDRVLASARQELAKLKGQAFLAFVHFEEPDEQGHLFGENSKEYTGALMANDRRLPELLQAARDAAGERELKIFILSDHGFDEGQRSHKEAPDTFWLAGGANFKGVADRRDFTPTLLELYGFDLKRIKPRLDGRSLIQ